MPRTMGFWRESGTEEVRVQGCRGRGFVREIGVGMGVKGRCGDCRSGLALGGGGYLLAGCGRVRLRPRGSEGGESDGGDGRGAATS